MFGVRRSEPLHNEGVQRTPAGGVGGGGGVEGGVGGLRNTSWGVGRYPCPMVVSPWKWAGARAFHRPHRKEGQINLGRVPHTGQHTGGPAR